MSAGAGVRGRFASAGHLAYSWPFYARFSSARSTAAFSRHSCYSVTTAASLAALSSGASQANGHTHVAAARTARSRA